VNELDVTAAFRALGDPTRRRIFEFLCAKSSAVAVDESGDVRPVSGATVGEVCCHVTGGDKFSSTVSFHLRELKLAGLIDAEREGKFMHCRVCLGAVEAMREYLAALENLTPQMCENEANIVPKSALTAKN